MKLKRKMTSVLERWMELYPKKALRIVGARQVGKTTVVLDFARERFEQVIEINFLEMPGAAKIFSDGLDAETLWIAISSFTNQKVIPNHTLLLLDEIQECPNARTAVKFLVQDGRARIVETGSMLGVHLKDVRSYPVGFEMLVHMYPLDFEEFLWNSNTSEEVLRYLQKCYETLAPVNEAIHTAMLTSFQRYLVVGGMPEVVVRYLETGDLAQVLELQKNLLQMYENDITKYTSLDIRAKILEIYRAIPSQLNSANQRFMLSQVIPKARLSREEASFLWLSEAGIALPCFNVSEPQIPLRLNEKRSLFKLFFFDVGLLCAASLDDVQFQILQGDLQVNQGSILENAFAELLKAAGFPLYYFQSKQYGEIDFLCQRNGKVDLLEIKSGASFKSHTSLTKMKSQSGWDFGQKLVFCRANLQMDEDVVYLPWYMILFYKPVHYDSLLLDDLHLEDLQVPEAEA